MLSGCPRRFQMSGACPESMAPNPITHATSGTRIRAGGDFFERIGLPMRIVSLLPSATEIVCGLGLEPQLVGVTHECDYPLSVRQLPKVTRTLIPHDATSAEIDRLVRERLSSQ